MKFAVFSIILLLLCCSENPTQYQNDQERFLAYDYTFIRNRYFFVDLYYLKKYESNFSEDLKIFTNQEDSTIVELDVWVSTISTDTLGQRAVMTSNPKNYIGKSYNQIFGDDIFYKGYCKKIDKLNYEFDPKRGFFWLNKWVADAENLGVSYSLKNGFKEGTLSLSDSNDVILLKIIKPAYSMPEETDTWPLMMRNVYSMGDTDIPEDSFEIKIVKYGNGQENAEEMGRTYLNLTGLDLLDKNGRISEKGNGKVDINEYTMDLKSGILIFPGINPFDPLSNSRFQISNENRAEIYNTASFDEMRNNSKFDIQITRQRVY